MEGCNNKVKDLKRNAYGYRNFNRFLHCIIFVFLFFVPQLLKKSMGTP
ncbi:MAG: transposase [[Eubacterium] siraeum]